jgi:predicted transcriptional regulator
MARAKLSLKLDRDLLARVKKIAKKQRVSLDDLVTESLTEVVEHDDFAKQAEAQGRADDRLRKRLTARYGSLYRDIAALMFEIDPAGINFETNSDEYEAEVGTVLPRLKSATNDEAVRLILVEEFDRWFEPNGYDLDKTALLARRLWPLWRDWVASKPT